MLEVLILAAIITYAIKKAADEAHGHWQSSKTANRRSTRGQKVTRRAASAVQHDVGYWMHQVTHGFPQVRHGLAAGWHAGRTAQAQGAAARQQARTNHLEGRARLIPEIRALRRRQQEALDQIRAAQLPEPEPATCSHGVPSPCGICDADPTYAWRLQGGQNLHPVATFQQAADRASYYADSQQRPFEILEVPPGGGPGRVIATRHPNPANAPAPATTSTGEEMEGVDINDPGSSGWLAPSNGMPGGPELGHGGTGNSGSGGTRMAGDTTYTQQLQELTAIRRDAEEEVNSIRLKRMVSRLDVLTSLGLDGSSLSEAAAIDDALQAQQKAAQQVLDATDAAIHGLKTRHGGIQEAVDNSPVAKPAQPEFYGN